MQRVAGERERRDDRNLRRGELGDESVLLGDGLVGPAPGPVELRDDGSRVLDADLVNAILVAAKGLQPAVAAQAHRVERVEHVVRCELRVRMRRGSHRHQYSTGTGSSVRHRYQVATLRNGCHAVASSRIAAGLTLRPPK